MLQLDYAKNCTQLQHTNTVQWFWVSSMFREKPKTIRTLCMTVISPWPTLFVPISSRRRHQVSTSLHNRQLYQSHTIQYHNWNPATRIGKSPTWCSTHRNRSNFLEPPKEPATIKVNAVLKKAKVHQTFPAFKLYCARAQVQVDQITISLIPSCSHDDAWRS